MSQFAAVKHGETKVHIFNQSNVVCVSKCKNGTMTSSHDCHHHDYLNLHHPGLYYQYHHDVNFIMTLLFLMSVV